MTIFVPGIPVPKGSTRAFVVKGRAHITGDNARTKPWQTVVRFAAVAQWPDIMTGGVTLDCTFYLPRPKAHYDAAGRIRPRFVGIAHTTKPDRDKLLRAVQDALTGVVYRDDSQVCDGRTAKCYVMPGEQPGVMLSIMGVT